MNQPAGYPAKLYDKALNRLLAPISDFEVDPVSVEERWELDRATEQLRDLNPDLFISYFGGMSLNPHRQAVVESWLMKGGFAQAEADKKEAAERTRRKEDLEVKNLEHTIKIAPWAFWISIAGLALAGLGTFIAFLALFKKY